MYYKTRKDSETGKKFQEVLDKMKFSKEALNAELIRLGAKEYRRSGLYLAGEITGVILPNGTEDKALSLKKSKIENLYVPNKRTKEGKELQKNWNNLPKVEVGDLNNIVGYDEDFGSHIAFAPTNENYFGFGVKEEWEVSIPADCEEITSKEYNELFKG